MKAFYRPTAIALTTKSEEPSLFARGVGVMLGASFFQALQVDPQEKRALELVATIDELFSIEARAREGGSLWIPP